MRFLCLHGMGTNSAVYEAQLAPVRAQLDPSHEYVFLDGEIECEPAEGMRSPSMQRSFDFMSRCPPPLRILNVFKILEQWIRCLHCLMSFHSTTGVDGVFPGPFYCYYSKPTQEQLEAAYNLIHEVIDEDGPFDGVFGFSQGGALAASMLLQHAKTSPHAPEPFKLVIFTCASLPFDYDTEKRIHKYNTSICPNTGHVKVRDWMSGEVIEASAVNGFISPLQENETSLQRYHPEREKVRIDVPTLHIMGRLDPFVPQSHLLADLCTTKERSIIIHDLGHKLPRDRQFACKAAAAIEKLITKVLFRC